jgi:hypothetical protein
MSKPNIRKTDCWRPIVLPNNGYLYWIHRGLLYKPKKEITFFQNIEEFFEEKNILKHFFNETAIKTFIIFKCFPTKTTF